MSSSNFGVSEDLNQLLFFQKLDDSKLEVKTQFFCILKCWPMAMRKSWQKSKPALDAGNVRKSLFEPRLLKPVSLTCDCSDIEDVEAAAVVRFSGPLLMPIIFSFGESANPCKTGSDVLFPCWSRGISACAEEITLISSPLQPVLLMPSHPL